MRLPSEKHLIQSVEASIKHLRIVLPDVGELLRRREHEVADGYPSQSMGEGNGSKTKSDPTPRAAMARTDADPTGVAIDTIFRLLTEIEDRARTIFNCHTNVFEIKQDRESPSSVKVCEFGCVPVADGKEDRLWNGMCRRHYDQFLAWKTKRANDGLDPSPVIFRAETKAAEKEQGKKR